MFLSEERRNKRKMNKNRSFLGDVLKLVTGTVAAQAFHMLASPILTRLFDPDAFGVSALFIAITGIVNAIICLSYENAILLPEEDGEAANLLGLSVFLVALVSGLSGLILWLVGEPLLVWVNAPELRAYWLLMPIYMFVRGLFLALSHWITRRKLFGLLSAVTIIDAIITVGIKLSLGFLGYSTAQSLIVGIVVGTVIATAVLVVLIWRREGRLFRESIRWHAMVEGAKRHRKFPQYSLGATLLNTLSWRLPAMLLSVFFSPAVLGFYSLGNRVLREPGRFLGTSMSQVFFQRAATARDSVQFARIVEQVFSYLVGYGLLPMLIVTFAGRDLFVAVFGEQWADAGTYSQILSVYLFFNLIAFPLARAVSVMERQEVALITNILLLVTRGGSLWIGGMIGDPLIALTLFSASGVLVYGGYAMWILKAAGVPAKNCWLSIRNYVLVTVGLVLVGWFVTRIFELRNWAQVFVYGVLAVPYYIWIASKDDLLSYLIRKLPRKGKETA